MIILLNGVSSSGKSSIARELLFLLDRPYFHLAVDAFGAMRATTWATEPTPDEIPQILRRTRAGFHRAVAGMAEAGNDLVVDHVLSEPWRLADLLDLLTPYEVFFVGVHCAPQELRRREQERGDRAVGQGEAQIKAVHDPGVYDLECDTTATDPRDSALAIRSALAARVRPSAFERLRA